MTLDEAQEQVDQWVRTMGDSYQSELTNLASLTESVGDVARVIAQRYGDQSARDPQPQSSEQQPEIGEQLARSLFVLICLANQTGVDLSAALRLILTKKTARTRDRHMNNPKLQ